MVPREGGQEIALVVPEIKIHLAAVIRHVDLTVPVSISTRVNGGESGNGGGTNSIGDMVPASMLM